MTGAMVLIILCKLLLGAVPGTGLRPVWSVEVPGSVREEFFVVKDSGPAVTWPRDLSAVDPDLPKMCEYEYSKKSKTNHHVRTGSQHCQHHMDLPPCQLPLHQNGVPGQIRWCYRDR